MFTGAHTWESFLQYSILQVLVVNFEFQFGEVVNFEFQFGVL
jgi:hypothetical protein